MVFNLFLMKIAYNYMVFVNFLKKEILGGNEEKNETQKKTRFCKK
jgi:hypothetical protein